MRSTQLRSRERLRACLSPTEAEPHCIGAEASLEHGWFPCADQAAMRACALEPDNPRAQLIVRTRLALGELDDARVAADRVLELQPFGALGHHARGLVFLRRQEWPEAEAEYRVALVVSPNDAATLNNCGLAVMNQHREKEAVELFTRAGAIDARRDVFRRNTAIAARVATSAISCTSLRSCRSCARPARSCGSPSCAL